MWLSALIQNLISTGDYKRECVFFGLHRGYPAQNISIWRHPKFVIGKLVLVVFQDKTINWYIYLVSYIKYILFMLVMQYTMVPNLRKKKNVLKSCFYSTSCLVKKPSFTVFFFFFARFLYIVMSFWTEMVSLQSCLRWSLLHDDQSKEKKKLAFVFFLVVSLPCKSSVQFVLFFRSRDNKC